MMKIVMSICLMLLAVSSIRATPLRGFEGRGGMTSLPRFDVPFQLPRFSLPDIPNFLGGLFSRPNFAGVNMERSFPRPLPFPAPRFPGSTYPTYTETTFQYPRQNSFLPDTSYNTMYQQYPTYTQTTFQYPRQNTFLPETPYNTMYQQYGGYNIKPVPQQPTPTSFPSYPSQTSVQQVSVPNTGNVVGQGTTSFAGNSFPWSQQNSYGYPGFYGNQNAMTNSLVNSYVTSG